MHMFQDLFGKQPLIVSLEANPTVHQKIEQLANAGIQNIELMSYAPNVLAKAKQRFPEIKLAQANIQTIEALEQAHALHLDFLSSPGFLAPLAQTAQLYKMPYMPGINNMSEAMQARHYGFHDLRVFPGNLELCKLLSKYAPDLKIYPMDVDWNQIEQFLDLPNIAAISLTDPDALQIADIAESLKI